jgi:hypothetical protein
MFQQDRDMSDIQSNSNVLCMKNNKSVSYEYEPISQALFFQ